MSLQKSVEFLRRPQVGSVLTCFTTGDCGSWNPEEESFVIQARRALKEADEIDNQPISGTGPG